MPTDSRTLRVYTDGSGIDGHIDTAAVVLNMPVVEVLARRTEYISAATTSTVYAAELRDIKLGLQIILNIQIKTQTPSQYTIFTNNQAAIQAIANPKYPSGQYILVRAVRLLDQLRDKE